MAISSVSATAAVAAIGSLSIQAKPKRYLVSFSSKLHIPRSSISSSTSSNARHFRAFVAPEQLDSEEIVDVPLPDFSDEPESIFLEDEDSDGPETSAIPINAEFDAMSPKQKIRIKLKSYFVPLIEDSAKQIIDAAKSTNAKAVGPVPLPTKRRIYCVLKSPHVHKDARFHFEIRTHQRLIDIVYPTAQTIDALMQLDLPAGVDVQVKL